MDYGKSIRLQAPFADTADRVRRALKDQGFGVLTEIDVRATVRDKLGEDMEDYLILGACNPPLAHRALTADRTIGLLLACNVGMSLKQDRLLRHLPGRARNPRRDAGRRGGGPSSASSPTGHPTQAKCCSFEAPCRRTHAARPASGVARRAVPRLSAVSESVLTTGLAVQIVAFGAAPGMG